MYNNFSDSELECVILQELFTLFRFVEFSVGDERRETPPSGRSNTHL